jgi:hypothetical protein
MQAQTPADVHRLFSDRFAAGDIDSLMSLYALVIDSPFGDPGMTG